MCGCEHNINKLKDGGGVDKYVGEYKGVARGRYDITITKDSDGTYTFYKLDKVKKTNNKVTESGLDETSVFLEALKFGLTFMADGTVKYDNGGGVEVEEEYNSEEDLFQHTETLPDEVRKVLDKYGEDWEATYENCENMLQELEPLGYTFDYYLDAEPINLRKLEEFKTGGGVADKSYVIVAPHHPFKHSLEKVNGLLPKIGVDLKNIENKKGKLFIYNIKTKKSANDIVYFLKQTDYFNKRSIVIKSSDEEYSNGGGVGELPLIKRIKGYEIRYNEKEKTWKFPVFKGGEELTAFGYKSEAEEWIYDQLGSDFENGGGIGNQNALMVMNDNKQIKHHTEELNKVVNTNTEVPAWVVSKVHRSASDLSDATHYLDGVNSEFLIGGGIDSDLSFDKNRFKQRQKAFVGYLGDTISIKIAETFLGRKINSWNDDIITIGDTKYKKVYLRPEYKQIS
ncbi:MAG: hypothetical protein IPJ01_11945 [Micavibrio sp.]|nr:hypothetical protein [Micavibrio sp.]